MSCHCFFVSDLHGHIDRYNTLFSIAEKEKPVAIFLGGDLLPHHWSETLAGGDGFFRRRMRLSNLSDRATLGLTAVTPLCGGVWVMKDGLRENLPGAGGVPYRVGWMQDIEWGHEGNFQWQDVPLNAELAFGSRRGRSGFSTPFAVAHNNLYGGFLVVGLAWLPRGPLTM